MKQRSINKGFSAVELLIAVIIIGILAVIIVPRWAQRTEMARQKAALADLENLQAAMEAAAIDTGYAYRLYVLDDTRGGDGIGFGNPNDKIDGINDEQYNLVQQNPDGRQIFIDLQYGYFRPNYVEIYDLMVKSETAFNWNGPYINWNRDRVDSNGNAAPLYRPNNADDIPDDPWGNNYLLFTREGLVKEPEGIIVKSVTFGGISYDCDIFDRLTLLSLGPNGLPGDGTPGARFGTGDDLMRQF